MHYIQPLNFTVSYYELRAQPCSPLNDKSIGDISELDKSRLFFSEGARVEKNDTEWTNWWSVYHSGQRVGVLNQNIEDDGNFTREQDITVSTFRPFRQEEQARLHSNPRCIDIHRYDDYQWNARHVEFGRAYFPTFASLQFLLEYLRETY